MNFFVHSPQLQAWPSRLARIPRWGWIAIAIPVVVIGIIALLIGLVVFLVVGAIGSLMSAVRRLFRRPVDDGRRNVRVMVHSARVLDP